MAAISVRRLISHIRLGDLDYIKNVFLSDPSELTEQRHVENIFNTAASAGFSECIKVAFEYFKKFKEDLPDQVMLNILAKALNESFIGRHIDSASEILNCFKEISSEEEYKGYINEKLFHVLGRWPYYSSGHMDNDFRISAINLLTKHGADINHTVVSDHQQSHSLLHMALLDNNIKFAIAVVEHKDFDISKHQPPYTSCSPIELMLQANKLEPNESGNYKSVPRPCLSADKVRLMKLFFEKGGDPNTVLNGMSPLGIAVLNNDYESMKLLIDAGADTNVKKRSHGRTIAAIAREAGNPDIAILLRECTEEDIILKNITKNDKSLLNAVTNNSLKDVRLALANGANINCLDKPNKNKLSAFIYAVNAGADIKIFNELLSRGFDPNMRDRFGNTATNLVTLELFPFYCMDSRTEYDDNYKFSYNSMNKGKSVFSRQNYRKYRENPDVIRKQIDTYKKKLDRASDLIDMLISAGADMNTGNKSESEVNIFQVFSNTPEDELAETATVSSGLPFALIQAYEYLTYGLPTSSIMGYMRGIIGGERLALEQQSADIICRMLKAGLNPDSRMIKATKRNYNQGNASRFADKLAFYDTLLHSASKAGMESVVANLLQSGADPNAVNQFGQTPIYTSLPNCYVNLKTAALPYYKDSKEAEKDLGIEKSTINIIDMLSDAGGVIKSKSSDVQEALLNILDRNKNEYRMLPSLNAIVSNIEQYLLNRRLLKQEDTVITDDMSAEPDFNI